MQIDQNIGMYKDTLTWNPFIGCKFGCTYCGPNFRRQMNRMKQKCLDCYGYKPHYHPERLRIIPNRKKDEVVRIVFVCGYSDISFCDPDFTRRILSRIKEENEKKPEKIYYFQCKKPEYFNQFLGEYPDNVILLTTLETNRNEGYEQISKAPKPTERYKQFLKLNYKRKVITIEPIMDFDMDAFVNWVLKANPEYTWIGFNSKSKSVKLPEPSMAKFNIFLQKLQESGVDVRIKKVKDQ